MVLEHCADEETKLQFKTVYIYFGQLNAATIPDVYALPRTEHIIDGLAGMSYYTVIYMKSGYHQIEIDEERHSQ